MDEAKIRNAILVELVMPKPMGEDVAKLKKVLGRIPFLDIRRCLDGMISDGLVKEDERIVEGSRAATICIATRKGIMSLAENTSGLMGRESHDNREEVGSVCR